MIKLVLFGTVVVLILSFIIANLHFNPLPDGVKADKVIVSKQNKTLQLMSNGSVLKSYPVSFGANPVGHKIQEGDERTPEGKYLIDWRNPQSSFYLSLHISYPDSVDKENAAAAGLEPGGLIMIHGMRNRFGWIGKIHRLYNWTDGCIAVTNKEMDEIWRAVDDGTVIEILK